ncbi:MAG: IS256 family transposase [Lentisphaeraceae bacterium]|nr:IS256 family transposase [Lentisphaeraceae bacterium]
MKETSFQPFTIQDVQTERDTLNELLQTGARRMLMSALELEIESYLNSTSSFKDSLGRRLVVRNGYGQERTLNTEIGTLRFQQPRINDKRPNHKFESKLIPKYARNSPTIENLIPVLYLKGISTGQFQETLKPLFGEAAKGLSAQVISKLIKSWEDDYEAWNNRDLSNKEYVYFWADGIYSNVRLDEDRVCTLVILGTLADGRKELVSVVDGYRESSLSWKELLLDLKKRGLQKPPKLAVADGALGFWKAVSEVFPEIRTQRCWVHKTANILDKMPKKVQEKAKKHLHEIYMAETKKDALEAYDYFLELYRPKYPKACFCLEKDKSALFTFFDFPAEHWQHIRTSNPIESTFATVRHRTKRTKGRGTRKATVTMVWKMILDAQKSWRRIRGYKLIHKIIEGIQFVDGIEKVA